MKLGFCFYLCVIVGSTSFAVNSEIKEYSVMHPCRAGEVAVAETKIGRKGDGTFSVRVKCSPADCFVSLPHSAGYTVKLVASRLSFIDLKAGEEMASMQTVAEITAQNKSQARAEVQKLVEQGVCNKVIFDSSLNYL